MLGVLPPSPPPDSVGASPGADFHALVAGLWRRQLSIFDYVRAPIYLRALADGGVIEAGDQVVYIGNALSCSASVIAGLRRDRTSGTTHGGVVTTDADGALTVMVELAMALYKPCYRKDSATGRRLQSVVSDAWTGVPNHFLNVEYPTPAQPPETPPPPPNPSPPPPGPGEPGSTFVPLLEDTESNIVFREQDEGLATEFYLIICVVASLVGLCIGIPCGFKWLKDYKHANFGGIAKHGRKSVMHKLSEIKHHIADEAEFLAHEASLAAHGDLKHIVADMHHHDEMIHQHADERLAAAREKQKAAKAARDAAKAEALGLGIGGIVNPMVWYTFYHTGDDPELTTADEEEKAFGQESERAGDAHLSEEEKSVQFGAEVGRLEFVEYRDEDWKRCAKGIIEELKAKGVQRGQIVAIDAHNCAPDEDAIISAHYSTTLPGLGPGSLDDLAFDEQLHATDTWHHHYEHAVKFVHNHIDKRENLISITAAITRTWGGSIDASCMFVFYYKDKTVNEDQHAYGLGRGVSGLFHLGHHAPAADWKSVV